MDDGSQLLGVPDIHIRSEQSELVEEACLVGMRHLYTAMCIEHEH